MARLPRLVLAGQPHLVIQGTLDHRPAFAGEADQASFIDVLRASLAAERVQLHAYALRPDELRLIATPAQASALARLMQALGRRYVVAYNQRHQRSGTLWSGRFKACALEPGDSVLAAMAWVEQGANVSSAPHHLGDRRDALITDPPDYWHLGNTPFEREAAWRERLSQDLAPELSTRLRRAAGGGWPVGSPAFVQSAARTGRAVTPRAPGRPRGVGPA